MAEERADHIADVCRGLSAEDVLSFFEFSAVRRAEIDECLFMLFKNFSLSATLAVACALPAAVVSAQVKRRVQGPTPCPLTKEQFPKVRGLYLGMPSAEVTRLYPFLEKGQADEAGESMIFFNGDSGQRPPPVKELEGVFSMTLDFIDDRLYHYWIYYDDYEVRSMEEHARNISRALKLPYTWDRKHWRIRCRDFSVYAIVQGSAGLVVEDDQAVRLLYKRRARIKSEGLRRGAERKRQEEKRRRVFRP